MGGSMNLFQLLDRDQGLNGRAFSGSTELLDKEDACTALQHQGCAGVAQQVEGATFA